MSAEAIAAALTLPSGPFPYRRYLCVPNLSWGLDLEGEADLVALSPANWLTEVEIKISVADFRRDAHKGKFRPKPWQTPRPSLVSAFYYAMPEPLWPRISHEFPHAVAGLILVANGRAHIASKAPTRDCRKLTDAERTQLARLGTMRYWTRLSHKLDRDLGRTCA